MTEEKTTEVAQTSAASEAAAKKVSRKKQRRAVPAGQMHIQASFNNTIITFTDKKGAVLCASSAGACGFRGSKKGTAYAAQIASEKAAELAKSLHNMKSVEVFVKGVGLGRDAAIRAVSSFDMQVEAISDVTGVPHGGTRAKKQRRV